MPWLGDHDREKGLGPASKERSEHATRRLLQGPRQKIYVIASGRPKDQSRAHSKDAIPEAARRADHDGDVRG